MAANKDGRLTGSVALFLAVQQRIKGSLGRPITTKQQSVGWSISQSLHMSAITWQLFGYTCGSHC